MIIGKLAGFYAFSINQKYRIIFEILEDKIIRFHAIGGHDIY